MTKTEPKTDRVFIIGRQRSGTTVFRELLKNEGAYDCDEIFHGDISRPNRFYAYLKERMEQEPGVIHPQTHVRVFKDYLDDLRAKADGAPLALDVKYFGLNLIPTREDVDGRSPFLFRFMNWSNAKVVHIVRKNKLRILVSEELSKASGLWSVSNKDQLIKDKQRISLDPKQVLDFIAKQDRQVARVGQQLGKISGIETLQYEEMFEEDGTFSAETQAVACRCLGKSEVDPTPRNLKMNPEKISELVENFDEIEAALKDTPHAWMLHAD